MVTEKEATSAIKEVFPGYDKSLASKCTKPEIYGIQRVHEAERIHQEVFARDRVRAARTRRIETRHKHTFRATEEQEERLQLAKTRVKDITGKWPSDQAAFEYILHNFTEAPNV